MRMLWKSKHFDGLTCGERLVVDVSEPSVGIFIVKDKNEARKLDLSIVIQNCSNIPIAIFAWIIDAEHVEALQKSF